MRQIPPSRLGEDQALQRPLLWGPFFAGREAGQPAVLMAWSGGKDSSLALAEILRDDRYKAALTATRSREPGLNAVVFGDLFLADIRAYRERMLARLGMRDLPEGVDPCGENGEFHTFVYAGPIFPQGIPHRRGEIVVRHDRFVYRDLVEQR